MSEIEFKVHPEAPIDPAQHKSIIDNVRLWDWRAFHDTVTQIQALRPTTFSPIPMWTAIPSTARIARCC